MSYLIYFLPITDYLKILDVKIENFLHTFRYFELVKIFTWITVLAEWQMIISFAITVSIILLFWNKKTYLIPLWLIIFGSGVSNLVGKIIFHRPRPEIALYVENTFSFPSLHATLSIAFFGFVIYVLLRHIRKQKYKLITSFAGVTLILFIGLSRLYLGVHFLSDVLGGYLLGLFWLVAGIIISERLNSSGNLIKYSPSRKIKIISYGFVVMQLIFYAYFAVKYNPIPNR